LVAVSSQPAGHRFSDNHGQKAQQAAVLSATDILSRQKLDVRGNALTVTVPMGILRVIDIEHR